MTKCGKYLFSAVIATTCFLYIHNGFLRAPAYAGRDLGAWSDQLTSTTRSDNPLFRSTNAREQAIQAIRSIGPKAIPYALERLTYRKSELRTQVDLLLSWLRIESEKPKEESFVRAEGITIFYVLGTSAERAAPSLYRLAQVESVSLDAARALGCIGPKGIDSLSGLLTNQNSVVRRSAIMAFIGIMERQNDLTPPLARVIESASDPCLNNRQLLKTWLNARSELFPGLSSDLVLLLRSPIPATRAAVVRALPVLNMPKKEVVAALSLGLEDPDPIVRRAANDSLMRLNDYTLFQKPDLVGQRQ